MFIMVLGNVGVHVCVAFVGLACERLQKVLNFVEVVFFILLPLSRDERERERESIAQRTVQIKGRLRV